MSSRQEPAARLIIGGIGFSCCGYGRNRRLLRPFPAALLCVTPQAGSLPAKPQFTPKKGAFLFLLLAISRQVWRRQLADRDSKLADSVWASLRGTLFDSEKATFRRRFSRPDRLSAGSLLTIFQVGTLCSTIVRLHLNRSPRSLVLPHPWQLNLTTGIKR